MLDGIPNSQQTWTHLFTLSRLLYSGESSSSYAVGLTSAINNNPLHAICELSKDLARSGSNPGSTGRHYVRLAFIIRESVL
jgi:hypothetical protein